jgi:EmrB/QacA subfamily drug resistance transporter
VTLSPRDRTLTLVGIILAMFLGALDQTIVATALPRIVEDLAGLSRYAWVATAYLLAATVLVPVYGKLADMYSRKALELVAVGTFLVGSVACGAAGLLGPLPLVGDGMNQLIASRALQGLGAAGLFALAFIVIADLYPARVRGRYQGFVGAAWAVASVLGPWVGGLLTDHAGGVIPGVSGWRWVFLVNLPLGAVALWFIVTRMPPLRPSDARRRLDLVSASLLVLTLVPLVLGLQLDKAAYPWGGEVTLSLLGAAVAFGGLFVWRSLGARDAVLDVRLFGNRVFTTANVAGFLLGAVFLSTMIFLPLYMVNVLGVSATRAGLSLIPFSLGTSLGAISAGQVASRLGRYKRIMVAAALTLALAVYLLSTLDVDTPYWQVTVFMLIAGAGVGPGLPLYTLATQNAVDPRVIGQATSASQFFRQIGGAVGAAVMGTVLTTALTASFQSIGTLGDLADPAALVGELAQTGGADVADAIRAEFAARAAGLDGERATRLRDEGEAVAARVETEVRRAFADAVTAVFSLLLWVAAAAVLATTLVPSLELRSGVAAGSAEP